MIEVNQHPQLQIERRIFEFQIIASTCMGSKAELGVEEPIYMEISGTSVG